LNLFKFAFGSIQQKSGLFFLDGKFSMGQLNKEENCKLHFPQVIFKIIDLSPSGNTKEGVENHKLVFFNAQNKRETLYQNYVITLKRGKRWTCSRQTD
jgi:hypothetical protein